MSVIQKKNSEKIIKFIKNLKIKFKLGTAQDWWPDYIYRVDNITAAAKILNMGKLLSRNAALSRNLIDKDCASSDVIGITDPKWLTYVRLYFRPRTPTQYANEGFRPPDKLEYGAHCPIPIVMLFDSCDLLTRETTLFSDGNLAKNACVGDDYDFLKKIPFEKVYHNKWFDQDIRDDIIFRRHAEVVIPNELDLSALRFIGCRTQAEYETLIHLLNHNARKQWADKIGLGSKMHLHNKRWTFVESVELNHKTIEFQFNPSSETPGPFNARVDIEVLRTNDVYYWESSSYKADSNLTLDISNREYTDHYIVQLVLNNDLAYKNRFLEIDTPF